VKEQLVNTRIRWGQAPIGWGQPHFPGWAPLVDPGPRPLQTARSVGRWLWPTLAVGGFLAVVVQVLNHDDPAPGLSVAGMLTVALAAAVVILLTIHRRSGPGPLARTLAEYTVVALLATLIAAPGGGVVVDQQPADHAARADARAQAAAGDDRPAVLRAGATVVRAVTGAARAVAGAVRWLVDLWRQADPKATPPNSQAMAARPFSPPRPAPSTWRSP
jgi:hypothetical protein